MARSRASLWLLAVLPAVGCADWEEVQFTADYGFCARYCETTVTVDTLARGAIEFVDPQGRLSTVREEFSLPERAPELAAAVERSRSVRWEERYGCPDCVDQGAYTVRLTSRGRAQATVLDPASAPDAFRLLVEFFDRIRAEHPKPE